MLVAQSRLAMSVAAIVAYSFPRCTSPCEQFECLAHTFVSLLSSDHAVRNTKDMLKHTNKKQRAKAGWRVRGQGLMS